jgi:hypothetical protein
VRNDLACNENGISDPLPESFSASANRDCFAKMFWSL